MQKVLENDKWIPTITLTSENFKNLDSVSIKDSISISANAKVKSVNVDSDGIISITCEIENGSIDTSDTKTIKEIDKAETMDELDKAGKKLEKNDEEEDD